MNKEYLMTWDDVEIWLKKNDSSTVVNDADDDYDGGSGDGDGDGGGDDDDNVTQYSRMKIYVMNAAVINGCVWGGGYDEGNDHDGESNKHYIS
uniref:Uncharacterized protein n=1 Tax=Glossina morsitans morsitans TaxID=37546 RepID=A0A1B0FPW1_GLOMM